MKTSIILSASALMIALSACSADKPSFINYSCDNGEVLATQILNDDRIAVQYNGKVYPMERRMAGSGARYTGEGFQWWSKGNEGKLQPLSGGENYATAPGMTCTEIVMAEAL